MRWAQVDDPFGADRICLLVLPYHGFRPWLFKVLPLRGEAREAATIPQFRGHHT